MSCDNDKECCKENKDHNEKECCKNKENKKCEKKHGNDENCQRRQRCCHGHRKQAMRLKFKNELL